MCLSPPISTPTVPTLTLHNPLPFWRLLEAALPDPAALPSVRLLAELDAAEDGEDFGNRLDEWYAEANSVEVRDTKSEEHTSELQSLMRISYAVFCLKKNKF